MVNINIEIPDDVHKKAKLKSVLNNITLKEFIIQSIEESLRNSRKKNG